MITPVNNSTQLNLMHNLQKHSKDEADQLQKLSTGKKINKGSDDVVGLLKSQELTKAIKGLNVAQENTANGSNLLDTASGGLLQTLSDLQDLRELAVKGADGSLSASDRNNLQNRANDVLDNIHQISQQTQFDGQKLLNGDFQNKAIQVGDGASDSINLSIDSASPEALDVNNVDLSSSESSTSAISSLDAAITQVTSSLINVGQSSNRLQGIETSNNSTLETLTKGRSVIEDLDYAKALGKIKTIQINKQAAIQLMGLVNNMGNVATKLLG